MANLGTGSASGLSLGGGGGGGGVGVNLGGGGGGTGLGVSVGGVTGLGVSVGVDIDPVVDTAEAPAIFSCVRPQAASPRTAPIAMWNKPAPCRVSGFH